MITIRSRKQHVIVLRAFATLFALLSAFLFASLPIHSASAKDRILPSNALDVFIVADTSSRFGEDAFRTVKSTVNAAVSALPSTARIGVITYGPWSGAVLVQPAEANRDAIVAQLATTLAQGDRSTLSDAISFTIDSMGIW